LPAWESRELTQRAYIFAVFAVVAAGVVLRFLGVLPVPLDFWADEAWWATLLATGEYAEYGFRPFGYMALCKALLAAGPPEIMLRLPSVLGAVAGLLCLWRCAELSLRTRVAVLFALLLAAFHPKLLAFAKEFKPYAFEVFVYSALLYWSLACLSRGASRRGLAVAALIALPFCYPVVFLYPAIATVIVGEKPKILRRMTLRHWVWTSLVVVPILVIARYWLFETTGAGSNWLLWGTKYDVFPVDTGLLGGIAWYARKTWSLATLPGALDGMPVAGQAVFGLCYIGGVAVLAAARRWRELLLLAGPLLGALAANMAGFWPYGAFRANLFLIPGTLLVAAHAVDWVALRHVVAAWAAPAAIVLVAALIADPQAYLGKRSVDWVAAPQLTEVLADIATRRQADGRQMEDVIVADWHAWRPILYYLPRWPVLNDAVDLVRGPLADVRVLESEIASVLDTAQKTGRPTRVWVIVLRLDTHAAIESAVAPQIVYRREFNTGDRDYHPLLIELEAGPSG
jgi:hypothetical protein